MIKAHIVDDDLVSIHFLEALLKNNFANLVKVTATSIHVDEAKMNIETNEPDLVFLDINLPDKDGFQLLDSLRIVNFETIVTTGNKNFAADAFKINALDFLVKPIQIPDLQRSLNKAYQKINAIRQQVPRLGHNKIGLPTNRGVIFINPTDIMYCEADNNYSLVHFANGKHESISRTLKEVELVMREFNFYRIHKSYLINFDKISQFIKSDGGSIIVENYEVALPVSKMVREELMSKLKML